jgi:hypothetical protein
MASPLTKPKLYSKIFYTNQNKQSFQEYQRNKMASRATNFVIITEWLFSRNLFSRSHIVCSQVLLFTTKDHDHFHTRSDDPGITKRKFGLKSSQIRSRTTTVHSFRAMVYPYNLENYKKDHSMFYHPLRSLMLPSAIKKWKVDNPQLLADYCALHPDWKESKFLSLPETSSLPVVQEPSRPQNKVASPSYTPIIQEAGCPQLEPRKLELEAPSSPGPPLQTSPLQTSPSPSTSSSDTAPKVPECPKPIVYTSKNPYETPSKSVEGKVSEVSKETPSLSTPPPYTTANFEYPSPETLGAFNQPFFPASKSGCEMEVPATESPNPTLPTNIKRTTSPIVNVPSKKPSVALSVDHFIPVTPITILTLSTHHRRC